MDHFVRTVHRLMREGALRAAQHHPDLDRREAYAAIPDAIGRRIRQMQVALRDPQQRDDLIAHFADHGLLNGSEEARFKLDGFFDAYEEFTTQDWDDEDRRFKRFRDALRSWFRADPGRDKNQRRKFRPDRPNGKRRSFRKALAYANPILESSGLPGSKALKEIKDTMEVDHGAD